MGRTADWAYLGSDETLAAAAERRRGTPPLPAGDLLRAHALRLRKPFLAFVSALAAGQKPEAFWAGTLAWKDPATSDLFLLCCRLSLGRELAAKGTALVVEDPWLYRQLRADLPDAELERGGGRAPASGRSALLGLMRRLKWLGRVSLSRLRWAAAGPAPLPAPGPKGRVMLITPVTPRSFVSAGWTDPFNPGLAEELAAAGASVARVVDPEHDGFERECAARGAIGSVLWAGWLDVLAAFVALPGPRPAQTTFAGLNVDFLLDRERLHDLSRASRCSFELSRRGAARLLDSGPWTAAVFPCENQPWERMLELECAKRGVRTVGVQHAALPTLQLSFFAGPGDPLPDVVLCMGETGRRQLAEGGVPEKRLVVGGSRRFAEAPAAPQPGPDVLVVLPIDPAPGSSLLSALGRAFPRGGEGRFVLRVKPHPSQPVAQEQLPPGATLETAPLPQALMGCGTVLFTGTTAGLEALRAGRAAVRYRPERLLDVDPSDSIEHPALLSCGDADLRETVERARGLPAPAPGGLSEVFAPVDRGAWTRAIIG